MSEAEAILSTLGKVTYIIFLYFISLIAIGAIRL